MTGDSRKSICRRLEAIAQLQPDTPAIWISSGCSSKLTFREFNERSNQLARYLHRTGVRPNDIVAVSQQRSVDLIISVFAVLKCGAAFLPMLPDTPPERLKFILKESDTKYLISDRVLNADLNVRSLDIREDECFAAEDIRNLGIEPQPSDLAYVIYTSGSSGRPKGVMVEHGALENRLLWMQQFDPLSTGDVILQKTPIVFDVSVWEVIWWAVSGASLCLMRPRLHPFPMAILSDIEMSGVTTLHFIPSMLSQFLKYVIDHQCAGKLSSIRTIFCSGEALTPSHVALFDSVFGDSPTRLVNLYGPTEATIDVTFYECPKFADLVEIPIGKPISNTEILILRDDHTRAAIDEEGEICIAGVGLARGYINNPEATKNNFIKNPFGGSGRIYKTGDLGRCSADGNIWYRGRRDNQIKIRGMRIELSEIEAMLEQIPSIKVAAAIVENANTVSAKIKAFVVADESFDAQNARDNLRRNLPDFMIPAEIATLPMLPKTPSGKVDRRALKQLVSEGSSYVR